VDVLIIGGGIGGQTLALTLHAAGLRCRVFEAASEIKPLGVGINLLPHAMRELTALGVQPALARVAIEPKEFAYFTHNGQFIFSEPCGVNAGYPYPHYSIHRGDLLMVLYGAARERIGDENIVCNRRCVRVEQDDTSATAHFVDRDGNALPPERADIIIACDGIHSMVRKQFHPNEGPPVFHGINIWRGVTIAKPFLTGGSITRIGGLFTTSKLLFYPIRDNVDGKGNQLINWSAEVVQTEHDAVDWSKPGNLDDFYPIYKDWSFDWLDAARMLREAEFILTYPMVDRHPIDRWTFGRITLLGDAAHPMYPRGGNGGAQSIIDAARLAHLLKTTADPVAALKAYEAERIPATSKVVMQSRNAPPDQIIDLVEQRTGGKRFDNLDDVVTDDELRSVSQTYSRVAGYDMASLRQRA
jgi:2-polyprenyl-6-methoxyphenol hydroxylase-like FAD-dependent oxidoreductase